MTFNQETLRYRTVTKSGLIPMEGGTSPYVITSCFKMEKCGKVQTGERSPLWCTLLDFIQADGECFMKPLIVHQTKEYSKYLHFDIPLECTVHHKPSGYMDR